MRSNLHRGFMAVVFAGALAIGGASPAAAQGPVWREAWDWIGRLWNSVNILQPLHDAAGLEIDPDGVKANGDCGPEIDPDGKPRCVPQSAPICTDGDCGPEIDPNG